MKRILMLATLATTVTMGAYAQNPRFALTATYTGSIQSQAYDAVKGHAIEKFNNGIRIIKMDAQGNHYVMYATSILEGVNNAAISVSNDGLTVIALIETPTRILGKRVYLTGTGYQVQDVDLTPVAGAMEHHIITSRSPHGMSFLSQYKWSQTGPTITKMGVFNFNGTSTKNVTLHDTLNRHVDIKSDANAHYVFSYWTDEVFMEIRNNDASLSYNNGNLVALYNSFSDLTDIMQTDSTIRMLVRHYPDTIIEKEIWKNNGVSIERYLIRPILPGTKGEEYIFPMVLMADKQIIQHRPVQYGVSDTTATVTFPGNYTEFTTFPVSGHFFIWVATYGASTNGAVQIILMDQWLSAKHTYYLGGGLSAQVIRGGYQYDPKTFIIYGDKIANGDTVSVIYTLSFEDIETGIQVTEMKESDISVYPNPAVNVLNIVSNDGGNIEGIAIHDMSGRVVKYMQINKLKAVIDIQNLPAGNYTVTIRSEKGVAHKKIVRQE